MLLILLLRCYWDNEKIEVLKNVTDRLTPDSVKMGMLSGSTTLGQKGLLFTIDSYISINAWAFTQGKSENLDSI